jgi:hypothetical protein
MMSCVIMTYLPPASAGWGVMKQQIGQGYDSFIDHKAVVKLEALYYHRIVFDEFHELGGLHGATQAICGSVKGRYCWGMTGTVHCYLL